MDCSEVSDEEIEQLLLALSVEEVVSEIDANVSDRYPSSNDGGTDTYLSQTATLFSKDRKTECNSEPQALFDGN